MPHVITLTDGPHRLDAPTGREIRDLQRLGYRVDHLFSPFSLMTHVTEATNEQGDIIAEFAPDTDFDFSAIADHIAVLMRDPEWDADRVSEHFVISEVKAYFDALRALGAEAFGGDADDPKASSGDSPA